MNEQHFLSIYHELIDDNPFAVRAVLKILDVTFDDSVPTLAVTCEDRPRLLVNLDFVSRHCRTEEHVKAVITHEFLHVLLRHTEQPAPFTKARHIAFDAVINALAAVAFNTDADFTSEFGAGEQAISPTLAGSPAGR